MCVEERHFEKRHLESRHFQTCPQAITRVRSNSASVSVKQSRGRFWSQLTILLASSGALCDHESHTEAIASGSLPYLWREAWRKVRIEYWPALHRTTSRPASRRFRKIASHRLVRLRAIHHGDDSGRMVRRSEAIWAAEPINRNGPIPQPTRSLRCSWAGRSARRRGISRRSTFPLGCLSPASRGSKPSADSASSPRSNC